MVLCHPLPSLHTWGSDFTFLVCPGLKPLAEGAGSPGVVGGGSRASQEGKSGQLGALSQCPDAHWPRGPGPKGPCEAVALLHQVLPCGSVGTFRAVIHSWDLAPRQAPRCFSAFLLLLSPFPHFCLLLSAVLACFKTVSRLPVRMSFS